MRSMLRLVQFFALGTWVGAILYFSLVVAPGALRSFPHPDQASAFIAYSIGRLHADGIVLGIVYLVATMLAALGSAASICVELMVILSAISQYLVVARMETLRLEMGSVLATPPENPMRAAFERLHDASVWLEVVVLIAGIAALYLTARDSSTEKPADFPA